MSWLVTALLAAVASRFLYPVVLERRDARRFPRGPSGIVRGAEPITKVRKGAPAVLLIHGGGDTPQVMGDLASYLYANGYSVHVPLLAAHGRSLRELKAASADEWLAQCRRELQEMKSASPQVFLVGLSVGGAISVQLAADDPDVRAMVLLVPYLELPPAVRRVAQWARLLGWFVPYATSMSGPSIRDRAAARKALGHGILTPALLTGFRDTATRANQALPRVTQPTLVVHSTADNRISNQTARAAFARLGAKEKQLEFVEGGAHVITVDFSHERVFELTRSWLDKHRA